MLSSRCSFGLIAVGVLLTVTQSLGPLQRQREVEAYALQGQSGMVESLLARHC